MSTSIQYNLQTKILLPRSFIQSGLDPPKWLDSLLSRVHIWCDMQRYDIMKNLEPSSGQKNVESWAWAIGTLWYRSHSMFSNIANNGCCRFEEEWPGVWIRNVKTNVFCKCLNSKNGKRRLKNVVWVNTLTHETHVWVIP